MISTDSLTRERALQFKKKPGYKKIDPALLNKMITAIVLLEQLKFTGIPFSLKGGTALIFLLDKPRRFSIDIDIVTRENKNTLEKVFSGIIENSPFIKFEEDTRDNVNDIPKLHYKFFYDSAFQKEPAYILLDILTDTFVYPETARLPIDCEWLKIKGEPS
ncbi:MAG: nucleotidyl transferase AbiEii/AbiGii toxin family protein, partial [Elusimicrobiota bacterium]